MAGPGNVGLRNNALLASPPTKLETNKGQRSLAKLMLNSMWGKFGQRTNKIQVCEFTDLQSLLQIMDGNPHHINFVSVLTEHRVEIHYRQVTDDRLPSIKLNIFIVAFTKNTCHARLCLYKALHHLQERILYFDTDSVIYIQRPSDPPLHPPCGNYLGDFKNDLSPNDHIVEFCSGGPKTYVYQTKQGKMVCKVRGFSLNVQGSAELNYHVQRNNTLHELHDRLSHPRIIRLRQSHTIHCHTKSYMLETRPSHKDYKMVYASIHQHSEEQDDEDGQIVTIDDVELSD